LDIFTSMAEKIQKKVNNEMDLVMCPYYGDGVKDTRRLDAYLEKSKSPTNTEGANYKILTPTNFQAPNLVSILYRFL